MLALLLIAVMTSTLNAAVVIDRISVVVARHIIKASDIDRDIRITNFLNRTPLVIDAEAKRKAADRLIDQSIIRDEIASGGYERATDADAAAMLDEIRNSQYGASEARFRQSLQQYQITEQDLQAALLWELTVLKFIDQRFRPGVLVTDQEVRAYYDQHLADLKRQFPDAKGYEALAPQIRKSLEGEQINQQFETWLDETRKRTSIRYMKGAFQ